MDNKQQFLNGFIYKNPVLVKIIGIGPAVAAAYTLKNSFALCIIAAVLFITVAFFSYWIDELLPPKAAVPVYVCISALMLIPAFWLCNKILPGSVELLGVFAPLIAVNTMVLSCAADYGGMRSFSAAMINALGNIAGFCAVVIFMGALREVLAFGTLCGAKISLVKSPVGALALPFAGYIILAFAAAALRGLRLHRMEKREERAGK